MKYYLLLIVSVLLVASQNSCDKQNDPGVEIDLNTKNYKYRYKKNFAQTLSKSDRFN